MKLLTRIRLVLFILVAVILIVLFVIQNYATIKLNERDLLHKSNLISSVFAKSIKEALAQNRFDELEETISSVGAEADISMLIVYDNLGTPVAKYRDTLITASGDVPNNLRQPTNNFKTYRLEGISFSEVLIPILESELFWGHILIVYNDIYHSQTVKTRYIIAGATFLLGLIFVFLVSLYLSSYIRKPINELVGATQQIAKGNFDERVSLEGKDELTFLADQFNLMAAEINNNVKALSLKNEELEKTQNELRWLSRISQEIGDGVLVVDNDYTITFVNKSWIEMHGYDAVNDSFIGRHVSEFFDSKIYEDYLVPALKIMDISAFYSEQISHTRKDGLQFPTETTYSIMTDLSGKKIGIIQVTTDITRRIEYEKLILTEKAKAEEANMVKSAFLANISHELRTPLIGVIGFAEIIEMTYKDPELLDKIRTIKRSGTRLLETITLLIDVANIERGDFSFDLTDIDVASVLQDVVEDSKEIAKKKNLYIKTHISTDTIYISGERRIFRQVFFNLIDNSIKYTNSGGIDIYLNVIEEDNEKYVYISFKDSGIGIAPEKMELIFDEFRQASEGYSRAYEGAGLGLSLTKKFVEKLGGGIEVTSRVGEGTVFNIRFPLAVMFKHKDPISDGGSKKNILIIDNDPLVSRLAVQYLKDSYFVDIASNAAEGLVRLKESSYDVLLLDINLGKGMNGIEFASELKKMKEFENLPIVAFTAIITPGNEFKITGEAIGHCITKPFTKPRLLSILEQALGD